MHYIFYTPLINSHLAPIWSSLAKALECQGNDISFITQSTVEVQSRAQSFIIKSGLRAKNVLSSYYNTGRVALWDDAIETEFNQWINSLKDVEEFKIIMWNGEFDYQQDFINLCKDHGIDEHFILIEMAWFPQNENLYASYKGVNFKSDIIDHKPSQISENQKVVLDNWRSRNYPQYLNPVTTPKTVFVPLQVDTDTTIKLYSPFCDMREFIQFIESWVPDDYNIIVKLHPKADYNYLLHSTRQSLSFVESMDVSDLIASSEYVVGINSTVLLEGMLAYKKVIAFGQGVYSGKGVIIEADKSADFPREHNPDYDRINDYLYDLVFRRQISLTGLHQGESKYLFSRWPFNQLHPGLEQDIIYSEGKKMIKVGNSKIAKSAFLDCEKEGSITIGNDCEVRHNAVLEVSGRYNGSIEIGNHSVIGVNNWLQGSGKIRIGDDVILGPNIAIVSTNHMYKDVDTPVAQQPLETGEVIIEDDVWIGANVTVSYNVTIGAHSIIGANSFVNKDIPPYSIVAGSPAKVIKSRK